MLYMRPRMRARRVGVRPERRTRALQTVAGDEHPRSDPSGLVDRVAQRDVGVVRRAEIAHRRHARLERVQRVGSRELRRSAPACARRLAPRIGARRRIPVVRHVRVHVDHARESPCSA